MMKNEFYKYLCCGYDKIRNSYANGSRGFRDYHREIQIRFIIHRGDYRIKGTAGYVGG